MIYNAYNTGKYVCDLKAKTAKGRAKYIMGDVPFSNTKCPRFPVPEDVLDKVIKICHAKRRCQLLQPRKFILCDEVESNYYSVNYECQTTLSMSTQSDEDEDVNREKNKDFIISPFGQIKSSL